MSLDSARIEVARDAARLICEQGILDYRLAKNKALAQRGGLRSGAPSNSEIADCVAEYLGLFQAEESQQRLLRLRQTAVQAMRLCAPFSPRAVGAVVSGLATIRSGVQLQLFCAFDEQIDWHLGENQIPFDTDERRLRRPNGQEIRCPSCVFVADGVDIELLIFGEDDILWSPLSPIDGKPMRRLTLPELEALMAD